MTETVEVTGGSPLLKTDRADVATTFEPKQITELPVLDRNFTKFILLTPGTQQLSWQHAAEREPAGLDADDGERPDFSGTGYQLDGTENRDPILGIIVINPNLEAIGEIEDHLAELRRGVRPGDRRRRVGADQVGHERVPRQRVRVLPERQLPGAQPVHAAARRTRSPASPARDQAEPVRRLGRRSDHEEQGRSSSATTRARAAPRAARSCCRCRRRRRAPATSASTASTSTTRRAARPGRRGTQFAGNVIPASRLSPQALSDPEPDPAAEPPGTRERHARQLPGRRAARRSTPTSSTAASTAA